jgi:hypothetical protein
VAKLRIGVTWDYVQYPAGLAALGHDVYYIEDTRLYPVYQAAGSGGADATANVDHLSRVMAAFGLADRWAYRDEVSGAWYGLPASAVSAICRSADVFINLSCSTWMREDYLRIPVRALVDTDPMFTQIQAATGSGFTPGDGSMRSLLEAHTHLFTFGENAGAPDCRMPLAGRQWLPTRQPVCLEHWPAVPAAPEATAYTTVMNWSAGKALEYAGESWGQKDVEFRRVLSLPQHVPGIVLGVAAGQTGGAPFPADDAARAGWQVLDPQQHAGDWRAYQHFIRSSRGEFSVAKETYVKARTGWFSCRSACYLASGRPAVVQDTGWSRFVPSGMGLLAYDDLCGAAHALRSVDADLPRHSRAAAEIAREYFASDRVLSALLTRAGVTP